MAATRNNRSIAPRKSARIEGLDAARALAVIGMLMIHVGPRERDTIGGILYNLPHGRASILFIFIAGIGIALLSRRAGSESLARLRLAWMAVVFLPLGLVLQRLDHGIAVILHHYAAFYLLGMLLLSVPRRQLPAIAAIWTIVGPLIYLMARSRWPELVERESVMAGDGVGHILRGLVLTGPYPLLTWGAALAWGMWVGRLDLRNDVVRRNLLVCGLAITAAAATIAGFAVDGAGLGQQLLDGSPHSQMPFWLIGAVGSAMAVTGAMLLMVERWPGLFGPLVALGQLALSFYVAHLLLLHFLAGLVRRESVGEATISVLVISAIAAGLAVAWRSRFARGPLEGLLVWPFQPAHARR